jgi:hypothetical protein
MPEDAMLVNINASIIFRAGAGEPRGFNREGWHAATAGIPPLPPGRARMYDEAMHRCS